jgi:nucleoside-diphosphate-sugar epimerase
MPSVGVPSVAVVGAAGFVGRVLLRQLEERGIRATAVVRGAPELSVDGGFHVASSRSSKVASDGFDIVINLAYPTAGPGYEHPQQNLEIARTVEGLVRDGGRLIQLSTLAVFGSALDRVISATPVAEVRDNAYVESKIVAERLFVEQQAKHRLSLDIVRLGNVWGYASGTWAVPLVQKLITGRPVGIAGAVAYSNTTDVANVVSYLVFLIENDDRAVEVRYHHLAEFSGVTWSEWIDPIAASIGVDPVYADWSALDIPSSGSKEVVEALAPLKPRSIYQKLAQERVAGSWARTLVRRLPSSAQARLKSSGSVVAADPVYGRSEQTFLGIMAGEREFKSVLSSGWEPPLTKEQSLDGVLRWLGRG